MSSIEEIDDATFSQKTSQGTVLVDFSAEWCGPCKMMHPILDELAGEVQGKAKVFMVNIDTNMESTQRHKVTSVPTIIILKEGKEVKRHVGVTDKATLLQSIESA